MTTALFMLSLIALAALTIALLDWYTRRKDRQSKERRTA
jgi:hypothetical protein